MYLTSFGSLIDDYLEAGCFQGDLGQLRLSWHAYFWWMLWWRSLPPTYLAMCIRIGSGNLVILININSLFYLYHQPICLHSGPSWMARNRSPSCDKLRRDKTEKRSDGQTWRRKRMKKRAPVSVDFRHQDNVMTWDSIGPTRQYNSNGETNAHPRSSLAADMPRTMKGLKVTM